MLSQVYGFGYRPPLALSGFYKCPSWVLYRVLYGGFVFTALCVCVCVVCVLRVWGLGLRVSGFICASLLFLFGFRPGNCSGV